MENDKINENVATTNDNSWILIFTLLTLLNNPKSTPFSDLELAELKGKVDTLEKVVFLKGDK